MRKFIYSLVAVASLSMGSCYEDKGNYDYITLDEIEVDTVGCGIMSKYTLERFDEISLAPNIKINGAINNNAKLDYVWTLYSAVTGTGISTDIDTLGYERTITTEITNAGGSYVLQLTVTNPENNLKSYLKINCTIEETISAGWMVIYEPTAEPGTSDVGLVVNPLVKKAIIKNREFWDLYSSVNGERIPGKPVNCNRPIVNMTSAECIFGTTETLIGVNNDTFEKTLDVDDFFFEGAPEDHCVNYHSYGGMATGEMLIMGGNFYQNVAATSRNSKYSAAVLGNVGELAPWSALTVNMVLGVVYSQTNQAFYFVPYGGTTFTTFATQSTTSAFDVNDMGMEFIMGDWGRNLYDYMLMKKDGTYYLAVANFTTNFTYYTDENMAQGLYDMSNCEGLDDAVTMVSAYAGAHILYGSGSKLYRYYYTKGTAADVLWEAPAGEEITCVKFQKWDYSPSSLMPILMPNYNRVLHIATYNKSTGEGKLYQYPITASSSAITEGADSYIYTVPGRIKDMSWKWEMEIE